MASTVAQLIDFMRSTVGEQNDRPFQDPDLFEYIRSVDLSGQVLVSTYARRYAASKILDIDTIANTESYPLGVAAAKPIAFIKYVPDVNHPENFDYCSIGGGSASAIRCTREGNDLHLDPIPPTSSRIEVWGTDVTALTASYPTTLNIPNFMEPWAREKLLQVVSVRLGRGIKVGGSEASFQPPYTTGLNLKDEEVRIIEHLCRLNMDAEYPVERAWVGSI